MVMGIHLAFSNYYSSSPVILGLTISLLIPGLMLSNELRDFKRDSCLRIKTLTVRIGFKKAKFLYLSLLTVPLAVKAYKNTRPEYYNFQLENLKSPLQKVDSLLHICLRDCSSCRFQSRQNLLPDNPGQF